tara:strand:+ start:3392 stop:3529 length:138 start_codon:yes stop_codon:yes gene_type:complete
MDKKIGIFIIIVLLMGVVLLNACDSSVKGGRIGGENIRNEEPPLG